MRLDALDDDVWTVRNVATNETRRATDRELINAIFEGQLTQPGCRNALQAGPCALTGAELSRVNARQESPVAVQQMLDKRAWIDGLRRRGIDKIVDEIWVRTAIDHLANGKLKGVRRFAITTLANTVRELAKAGGDWSQLVPQYSGRGGAGEQRIHPQAQSAIQAQIDFLRANRDERINIQTISGNVRDQLDIHNIGNAHNPIPVPGYSTVSRCVHQAFEAREISLRNRGSNVTKDHYRENSFPRDRAQYPLLISEYDDLNAGVFLIDDKNLLPFGRAYITHGVCQNTDVPLGFDISHESRSYDSAMGAILDSLLPKDTRRQEFERCSFPWIGYGNQGLMLIDNASYNLSRSIGLRTDQMKLALAGARPFGPTEKCSIEHFNSMVEADFCKALPGWCGDKEDPKGSNRGTETAALTVSAFKSLYVRWVTGVYLNKHGIDGLTPKQRWFNHFKNHSPSVRWTPEEISLFRLRPHLLKFRASGGIKRLNLTYNSDELIILRERYGYLAQMVVHIDRSDLGYIKVTNPETRSLIHVPCTTDFRYADGLTEQQQKLILKMARLRGHKNPDLHQMVVAREELREMVSKERKSMKMSQRRFAKQTGDIRVDPQGAEGGFTAPAVKLVSQVITDLEWNIIRLEEVALELDDDSWESQ